MKRSLRIRMWVETAAAVGSLSLGLLTLVWREWIEAIFGVDPDNGNGAAEWIAVAVLGAVFVVSAILARRDWTRPFEAAAGHSAGMIAFGAATCERAEGGAHFLR